MTLRTVDLFAGCGGLSLGFQKEKYNIVAAFELWDVAVKCYKENFSHSVYQTDLSNVDEAVKIIRELKPDIIIGGPPCQDFSHAGKRIEADRASLTDSYAKIICDNFSFQAGLRGEYMRYKTESICNGKC